MDRFEPFLTVSLGVHDRNDDIAASFDRFTAQESIHMKNNNKKKCAHCKAKLNVVTKSLSVYRPPQVLMLHLKRYTFGKYRGASYYSKTLFYF